MPKVTKPPREHQQQSKVLTQGRATAPSTRVFCWICGDESSFPVYISPEETIGDLKEAILAKEPSTSVTSASQLKLCLANIPDTDEERSDFVFEDNERLAGSDKINEHFPAGFPGKKIHFAVKWPSK
jgi:hypothetical protein